MTNLTTLHISEKERIDFLNSLELLDTLPEDEFDMLTQMASKYLNAPVSLFSLVDGTRQWFKSRVGMDACETPRDISFCAHAIKQPELYVVENADKDPLFANNPLVTAKEKAIKFYTGVPIIIEGKYTIGTLCIIDYKPRVLTDEEKELLKNLGKQIEKLIELRLLNNKAIAQRKELQEQHERLKEFAGVISHDMKMPLANLIITSDILKKKYSAILDNDGINYLDYLKTSSLTLSDYISNILKYYESDGLAKESKTTFDIFELLEEIIEILHVNEQSGIHLPDQNLILHTNKPALEQVLLNLFTNALKYNDKESAEIKVDCYEDTNFYHFSVEDNGKGIAPEKLHLIFNLYETLDIIDKKGNKGHGIGLSMVKKICESLGGTIKVSSKVGKGTRFDFSIAKEQILD
ncbi:GAF domain-containing sensor histidine kinase [Rasiella sp. SM2506]|uniref:GAF domain-containing sensor histidine kinase n=1 Tax=Rasiella sp. SM2506 TaxID=3423914 RepID=UPI003D7A43BF